MSAVPTGASVAGPRRRGRRGASRFARIFSRWSTRIAGVVLLAIVGLAFIGPFLAPRDPTAILSAPFSPPGGGYTLGTDYTGEDVFSRVLAGGRGLLLMALIATVVGYGLGALVGLAAGMRRSVVDPLLMRTMDVLLAFPPILLLLVMLAGLGSHATVMVAGIALINLPLAARVVRSATLEVSVRSYVEAAIARGEPMRMIIRREVLPNIVGSIVASAGPALTVSILLVAGVSFLGLGLHAPTADWALMISENQQGLSTQPWPIIVPAALIALLTVSVNVLADAVARSFGHSFEEGGFNR